MKARKGFTLNKAIRTISEINVRKTINKSIRIFDWSNKIKNNHIPKTINSALLFYSKESPSFSRMIAAFGIIQNVFFVK